MRTNIVIDDQLMAQALKATGLGTQRAVVEEGLRLLVQMYAQTGIRKLRGQVAWSGDLAESRTGRVRDFTLTPGARRGAHTKR